MAISVEVIGTRGGSCVPFTPPRSGPLYSVLLGTGTAADGAGIAAPPGMCEIVLLTVPGPVTEAAAFHVDANESANLAAAASFSFVLGRLL